MKTDTLFYQLFQTFPELVFELVGIEPVPGYQFISQEIKEVARSFDGVLLPPVTKDNVFIYFVEVQFQPNPNFWWRFITESCLYLEQYKPPQDWQILALFANGNLDPGIPRHYGDFTPRINIIYANELEVTEDSSIALKIIEVITANRKKAKEKIPLLIESVKTNAQPTILLDKVLKLIETMIVYKFANLSKKELEAMFGLSELKQTRYYQDVREEAKLETKLETVPLLFELGLSTEQIATRLDLDIDLVRKTLNQK